jgi:Polyketide cyclase / dehydrase and lipid transport
VSIDRLSVAQTGARYTIEMRVHLDVPARAAYAVFANPDNLRKLNSDVREARIVAHGPRGAIDLYSRIRVCVLWLCRAMHQTQRMTFIPSSDGGEVDATVLPSGGDLREGRAQWTFSRAGAGTRLDMRAQLEPAFRVPPLIGPWLVKRWLRGQVELTATNLERLARAQPAVSSSGARRAR